MGSPFFELILFGPVTKGKVPRKKKPHGVSGGAEFLFFSKEVTANLITGSECFLLLLDLDLFIFIVIFLLASKSRFCPFSLSSAVTLRLGRVLKAKAVPTLSRLSQFNDLAIGQTCRHHREARLCKRIRHNCVMRYQAITQ